MPSSTKRSRPPTLSDLITAAETTTVRLSAETDVSIATIYRATKGRVPPPLHLKALARALGVRAAECRDAILRSGKGAS
jgi:hypothetical protein